MGNTQNKINYKQVIQQGIPLIKEWLIKQEDNIKEKEEYKEVERVIKEIETEEDWSENSYLDIRFILKPFDETLPLKIKRIFNVSTLDNYTTFIASRWFETIEDFINLELSTSKYQGNMTKFHYNPISLNIKTREFFDHLQTLYIYSNEDELFKDDERIKTRKECKVDKYDLWYKEMKQLEEWTELKCSEIIFDSNVDNWWNHRNPFISKLSNRSQLIIVIEDEEGQKFGGYIKAKIKKANKKLWWSQNSIEDPNAFVFSLNSNGRLKGMMKFDIEDPSDAFLLNDTLEDWLFVVGKGENGCDIVMYKQKYKDLSSTLNRNFNYGNYPYALRGRWKSPNYHMFAPKRFFIIQMM